jgi:carboxylesterase
MSDKTGVLLIHGFGGNTDEVKPFKDYLESRGYFVSCPELAGHTGLKRDLGQSNYSDWLFSVESALIDLQENYGPIVVIGFSMGGLIGLNLSLKYQLKALATLNTPIYYWDIARIAINIFQDVRKGKFDYLSAYIKSSLKYPMSAMISFRRFLSQTKSLMCQVECPIFIAQGLLDDTVQQRSADYIYQSVSSSIKQLKRYEHANHLICLSQDRDILFKDVLDFIENPA